ncbi:hypothetical protein [Flammeovirga pacifica]|uniref:Uncharacterized protein n=1 Tax=Flammeovirga pacifica TaxID=915059 RepID=A0A1S1Z187_FLAPC|nr:hypothetical protein [Flammeovirga pacifica]OHX66997.1 hypothetical protein NH26_11905 [Flammeovirga pacifica]
MSNKKPSFFEGFNEPFDMVNKLRICFYGLASFSVPFALMWYVQNKSEMIDLDPVIEPLGSIVISILTAIISIVAIVVYRIYNNKLKEIRKEPSLPYRLTLLLKAQCIKFIPLAISPIVVVILYRLTLEPILFGVYIVSMILFAMSNPSIHNVISDLRLKKGDKEVMLNNIPFDQTDMKL